MMSLLRNWCKNVQQREEKRAYDKAMATFIAPSQPYVLLSIYPHLNNQLLAVFRMYGIEARAAPNWQTAIAMMQRTPPKLVVGYVNEGENTALSLLQTMRHQLLVKDIPVIAIVQTSQLFRAAELEQAGISICFEAPLDPLPFAEYVKTLLESH